MKPANRVTTIVVHIAVRLNLPPRHAIGVADVDPVLTEAVEPWPFTVRRFLALHSLVMCAQGECTRGGVHRFRERSEALGEETGQRTVSEVHITKRVVRRLESFVKPADAALEILVGGNPRHREPLRIESSRFGPEHVEPVLQTPHKCLVAMNGSQQRAILWRPRLKLVVQQLLLESVVLEFRLKLPQRRQCPQPTVLRREQEVA